MENSPHGFRLLSNNGDYSYHVKLGKSAAIDFKKGKFENENDGVITEKWEVSYTVDGSTCEIDLTKTQGNSITGDKLRIEIGDFMCRKLVSINIGRYEFSRFLYRSPILVPPYPNKPDPEKILKNIFWENSTTFPNAQGDITETNVYLYDSEIGRGLFVIEQKTKGKNHTERTVAHYLAATSTEYDIGLSVLVSKIRELDDGHLDFAVDGPIQHPAAALFHMFDEVITTGIWKPTSCPHCAIIQRQQSESDQVNDGVTIGNYTWKVVNASVKFAALFLLSKMLFRNS